MVNKTKGRLNKNKKTLLLMGGSLGSKTINDSVMNNLSIIKNSPFQILWQTGKNYYDQILSKKDLIPSNIIFLPFIREMNYAYASSDIIIFNQSENFVFSFLKPSYACSTLSL